MDFSLGCGWWVVIGLVVGYPAIALFAVSVIILGEVLQQVAWYGVRATWARGKRLYTYGYGKWPSKDDG